MVVDDIRIVLEGPCKVIAKGVVRLIEDALEVFEGDLNLDISRDKGGGEGKTLVQASNRLLRNRIGEGIGRFGMRVKAKVRNLGVDYGAGNSGVTRGRVVLKGRVIEGKRRLRRAGVVGKRGRM